MKNCYVKFGKSVFDLIFSLLILALTWPIFIVIAVFIKLSSPGPIIFKQKRVGKNGKTFTLYKFRTMIKNAQNQQKKYLKLNEADGPVFKINSDPRFINGLGKILARSGLDELPNIINVLKRDMSWVGPRPLPVNEAKKINQKIRKIRQSTLPGITSLWVISGAHKLTFTQWMKLDKQYLNKINLSTDISILLKTAQMIIKVYFDNLY
ncbi:sugar transferase [Patescibacteria group bacterium]